MSWCVCVYEYWGACECVCMSVRVHVSVKCVYEYWGACECVCMSVRVHECQVCVCVHECQGVYEY